MNEHKIYGLYIVPKDGVNRAEPAIRKAMLHGQAWCRWQMGNRKTFTLSDAVVRVCYSQHPAAWYSAHDPFANPPELPSNLTFHLTGGSNRHPPSHTQIFTPTDTSGWYWLNALADGYANGVSWTDGNSYVIYVDAAIGPNQYAGGASSGNSGVCVLHGKDVSAVIGQDHEWSVCREIGGLFHEVLHTMNRPHPPPGPDFGKAIMGTGYAIYPECVLLDADKEALNANPLFTEMPYRKAPPGLCPFADMRPTPTPRPRPIPTPNRRRDA